MPQPHRKACKECRRLRLGCDREVPCYNCKRRGCSVICPDGTLEKGARSRSTIIIELQETIAELRNWNFLLEEALRKLQASISPEPHPLLRDRMPSKLPADTQSGQTPPSDAQEQEILDALGEFSIAGDGEMSLHGPTVLAEYSIKENPSLLSNLIPNPERPESPMSLPPDIILLSALFPFPPEPIPLEKLNDFVDLLPPYQTALTLSELYYQHFSWCVNPIPQDVFTASVLAECYLHGVAATSLRHVSPHILSILFMVCGLGSLANINNSHRFVEAEEFHTIARAALCVRPVYEYPTLHAAQSMTVMLLYHMCSERRSNGYIVALWSVMGGMCEMLNLSKSSLPFSSAQIDPSDFDQRKLEKECAELRKLVFWEIMNLDSWYAFGSGRAKSLKFNAITCKKPTDPDQQLGGGWHTWKHRFTETLDSVVDRAFRQKGSTYSLITQLDNELRSIPPLPAIEWPEDATRRAAVLDVPVGEHKRAMQRLLAKASVETGILHLHKWFFLQSIRHCSGNPFDHPFGYSVRATLEASCKLINAVHDIYQFQRVSVVAFRSLWTHAYSAAMVLGTFISVFPTLSEATNALISFDCVCEMFIAMEENRLTSIEALHVLRNLQIGAHRARTSGKPSFSTHALEMFGFWTETSDAYKNSSPPTMA